MLLLPPGARCVATDGASRRDFLIGAPTVPAIDKYGMYERRFDEEFGAYYTLPEPGAGIGGGPDGA